MQEKHEVGQKLTSIKSIKPNMTYWCKKCESSHLGQDLVKIHCPACDGDVYEDADADNVKGQEYAREMQALGAFEENCLCWCSRNNGNACDKGHKDANQRVDKKCPDYKVPTVAWKKDKRKTDYSKRMKCSIRGCKELSYYSTHRAEMQGAADFCITHYWERVDSQRDKARPQMADGVVLRVDSMFGQIIQRLEQNPFETDIDTWVHCYEGFSKMDFDVKKKKFHGVFRYVFDADFVPLIADGNVTRVLTAIWQLVEQYRDEGFVMDVLTQAQKASENLKELLNMKPTEASSMHGTEELPLVNIWDQILCQQGQRKSEAHNFIRNLTEWETRQGVQSIVTAPFIPTMVLHQARMFVDTLSSGTSPAFSAQLSGDVRNAIKKFAIIIPSPAALKRNVLTGALKALHGLVSEFKDAETITYVASACNFVRKANNRYHVEKSKYTREEIHRECALDMIFAIGNIVKLYIKAGYALEQILENVHIIKRPFGVEAQWYSESCQAEIYTHYVQAVDSSEEQIFDDLRRMAEMYGAFIGSMPEVVDLLDMSSFEFVTQVRDLFTPDVFKLTKKKEAGQ
jgi:hypothetical protein